MPLPCAPPTQIAASRCRKRGASWCAKKSKKGILFRPDLQQDQVIVTGPCVPIDRLQMAVH
jgi:hypothetical protein